MKRLLGKGDKNLWVT